MDGFELVPDYPMLDAQSDKPPHLLNSEDKEASLSRDYLMEDPQCGREIQNEEWRILELE